jgi:hypothetical protein
METIENTYKEWEEYLLLKAEILLLLMNGVKSYVFTTYWRRKEISYPKKWTKEFKRSKRRLKKEKINPAEIRSYRIATKLTKLFWKGWRHK